MFLSSFALPTTTWSSLNVLFGFSLKADARWLSFTHTTAANSIGLAIWRQVERSLFDVIIVANVLVKQEVQQNITDYTVGRNLFNVNSVANALVKRVI